MNYLVVAVVLCCAIASSFAGEINFRLCPGVLQRATISSVKLSGCNKWQCNVERGQYVTLKASFTPTVDVTYPVAKAFSTQLGITVPYPLGNSDACKNMKCPLRAGVPAVYTITVPVYWYVLPLPGTVQGMLEFDGGPGFCYEFDVKVVK